MKGATADPFIQRDRRITRELHFCVWTPLFSPSKNTVPYYVHTATHSAQSQPGILCVHGEMPDETWLSGVHSQNTLSGIMFSSEE